MTKEQYQLLEFLLGELRSEIGHSFCIIPGYLQDGPHIGAYGDDGNIIAQDIGPDIETTTERLKHRISLISKR